MRSFVLTMCWLWLVSACGPAAVAPEADAAVTGVDAQIPDAPSVDAPAPVHPPAIVYAHSGLQFYELDAETLIVSHIGGFGIGGASMNDIAVDRDGNVMGVTSNALWSIDPDSGQATRVASLSGGGGSYNGLSFLPGDAPGGETLVAVNRDGQVYEVDLETGESTLAGVYGGGLQSSGDMVAIDGLGIFAAVRYNSGTDRLALIDPDTYAATVVGDTSVSKLYGLGFWGDTFYGFSDDKTIYEIDPLTASATPLVEASVRWFGAGVTTRALVID